ncbi:MAG: DUF1929 domain-containing protein [Woeseiaceae bacterium]|nr:DUF1929 domain-containing protein [Woeseiaceae bacterium]
MRGRRVRPFVGLSLLLSLGAAFADYNYEYYEGNWSVLPNFDSLTPVATGTTEDFDISVRLRDSQYGFRFTGTITVETSDTYTFYTNSDDGSQLFIDGALVVDNDGLHGPRDASGNIVLSAGSYSITVTFFEQGGGEVLAVSWSNSSNGRQPISSDGVIGTAPNAYADGQWGPVIPWPHVAVSAANLPDGRVLTWSGSERDTWPNTEQTYSGTWDPATGEFVEIFHDGHNMFCAHLAMAEDGRVFVNGGRNQTNSPWTSLFDYRDNSWTQIENMASGGRWYPTTVALTDGDMFTAIGTATNQRYPDRWDPNSGWRIQTGIDFNDMVLDDYFSGGSHGESRWWPLLHVAPNGKLFHSGPTPQMHWINPAGDGSYEAVGGAFTDWYHKHGTTVMYDEGKLLTAGGWISGNNIRSTNQAFTVDLTGPAPVVAATQPMLHARKFQNGVMLPTGEVLVVGGNTSGRKFSDDGAILVPEFWNPDTGTWREGAPMTIPRNYHSVALLLTDGRVLAAGSGYNSNSVPASTHQDGQVYSPPYLFNPDGSAAVQPVISSTSGEVEVGATINIAASESIAYFSMIKMSSTTHGMNTDVRYLRPAFTAAAGNNYDVTLHSNPNVATPGYWMLFAVNSSGVPSEAHVIRVTAVDARLENRALNGVVSQSSTATGTGDLSAANAVDGDLTGTEVSGSLASTQSDMNAWWEIDLGQVYGIDTLRLWNRTDCCADRLSDFYILVSETPFASQDLFDTRQQAGVVEIFHPGVAGQQTNFAIGANGRYVRVQLANQDILQLAEVQIFGDEAVLPPPDNDLKVENGVLENVGSDWQTVTLSQSFADPVVVASVRYDASQLPAVTRVRNAAGDSFEVRVQNPSDTALSGYAVNYVVVEAGVYDQAGVKMEAVKYSSSVTDENGSWIAEPRAYQQTYSSPVVVGQVMTANDDRWSVFWASDGTTGNPPSSSSLHVGKHVAEDTTIARNAETVGYLVFESGTGSAAGVVYEAGVGADNVQGVVNAPPYRYSLSGDYNVAVVASAGMDGTNGGWPLLYGPQINGAELDIAIDEDQIADSERSRTTDQIAYIAMEQTIADVVIAGVSNAPEATGSAATFVASATGVGLLEYSWNFGDGPTPFTTDDTATHIFTTPGRHLVTLTVRDAEGNTQEFVFTQLVHLPLTPNAPSVSGGIVEYASRGEVWNVNPDNDSVTVVDTVMQAVVAEIPVGDEPRGLAIAPNGSVWVVSKGAATITVIDPATYSASDVLFLTVGSQPHGLVVGATTAYVALEATGEVVALDTTTGVELTRAWVGDRVRHLSLNGAESQLMASLFVTPPLPDEGIGTPIVDDGTNLYGAEVVLVDPSSLATTGSVVLQHSDRLVSEHSGPGVPNYVGPAVISPDGSSAWVPSKQDNVLAGALRGGQGMSFDQTVRAVTSKIEIPAMTENFTMRVDHDNASVASHAAFGPYGIHLFTALEGNREVAVVDVMSGVELLRFDVGRAPQAVTVSADGTRLYVHNFMDRSIGIYDVSQLIGSGAIEATEIATVSTVASESLPTEVFRGKQFFYDARDDRLAALDYMSCASCHNEGGEDGRVWDFTGIGEGLRNTISLEGRGGVDHGNLHWTANFDEVQDFEMQIRTFAGGLGLMDATDLTVGTRMEPLGDPKAGISADLDALAAYVSSLRDVPASPYRGLDRQLSADAQAGALLFESEGCGTCHTPVDMTDSTDGNGMHDVGTLEASSGQRLNGPLTGIDTPTLLGAWGTAPYLHDGSEATLESAIEAHSGVTLTAAELGQLGALIRELESGSELSNSDGPMLAHGTVSLVGDAWQTVTLPNTYTDMVVIASVQYDDSALPAVARVRNAAGNSFDLRVQNPSNTVLAGYTVNFVVAEAGVYNEAEHGIRMEAATMTSTQTARYNNWVAPAQSYQQSYTTPVVVGQVMSANDARWSVFWANNGGSNRSQPTAASFGIGKHIGEDPDGSRLDETIGYLVIEAGSGDVDGVNFVAGLTANAIEGVLQNTPYVTSVGGAYSTGVVSSVGMDGGNGGWPLLYGSNPLAGGQLDLAIDEDQLRDSERTHITEVVSYFLLQ